MDCRPHLDLVRQLFSVLHTSEPVWYVHRKHAGALEDQTEVPVIASVSVETVQAEMALLEDVLADMPASSDPLPIDENAEYEPAER